MTPAADTNGEVIHSSNNNNKVANSQMTTTGRRPSNNTTGAVPSIDINDVGGDAETQNLFSTSVDGASSKSSAEVAAADELTKRSTSVDSSDAAANVVAAARDSIGSKGGAATAGAKNPQESAKIMREYKILELVQTEKDYVEDLGKIVEGYMEEMKQHPPPDDMQGKEKIIFGNIAQIFEWHRDTFCKQIEQFAQQPEKLAQLFERHFRRLLMYVTFCQNKPKSDAVISDYVDTYFEELRKRLGHRLTLPDLLIKPVQRPMRYELLLKEMSKYTARAELDAAPFDKAIDLISQVCKLVDDSMEVGRLSGFEGNLQAQGKLMLQETFQVADASQLTTQLHATGNSLAAPPTAAVSGNRDGGTGAAASANSGAGGAGGSGAGGRARVDSSKCDDGLKFKERRLFLFEQIFIVSEVQYIGAHAAKNVASNLIKAFYVYKDHIQVNKLSLINDQAPHRFVVLMRDPHAGEKCYVVDAGDEVRRDFWVAKIKAMLDTQINFLRALQSPIDFQRRTQSFN